MTRLFSPFDKAIFYFPLAFIVITFVLLLSLVPRINPLSSLISFLHKRLGGFFSSLKPILFNKIRASLFLRVFTLLMFCNFFSVFPYNFPSTSQVSFVLLISGSFWLRVVLFSLVNNSKGFFSHLIPEGTPIPLTALLFLIELIRNLIRPLTLTVRLVANILAGHLLIRLLSSLVFIFGASGILYVGLNIVEIFVALIQAYIFTTIIVLYFSEA